MADAAVEEQFGPYLVYERLGVGGMATVHRALECGVEGFERVVALKRLLPHLAEDASFIKAFVREAKLASLLTHVNIVQIYELGRVGTEYFISMEYIDGRDVRRILRHARKVTGPAPIHVTVGLILQLCEALDYAHTKIDDTGAPLGLVHRDVSPSNLLVTSQGYLKVIDFGIAKAQSSQLRTQTGRVKGKLAYMSPEAISGSRELDARSDVWAVGVILHELLTARPLFASKNEYQTLLKVERGDVVPPSTFNQACPPELDSIVFKALERDPDRRFASAAELRVELDRLCARYRLRTNIRDVAQWLDWAFALEAPSRFSGDTIEPTEISISMRTPTPAAARSTGRRKDEEDAAVELAWGGSEVGAPSGPIVLDDVPDVSAKHLAVRLDTNDDDIPTPEPSHSTRWRPRTSRLEPLDDLATPPDGSDAVASAIDAQLDDEPGDPADTVAPVRRGTYAPGGPAETVELTPLTCEPAGPAETVELTPLTREPALPPSTAPPRSSVGAPAAPALATSGLATGPRSVPRTKPGVAPASAHRLSEPIEKRTQQVTIGAALVERNQPRRGWLLAGALALLAIGGAALAWYATTRGSPAAHAPKPAALAAPSREPGTVKFATEPVDAEILIEGQTHTGSPWQLELAPGVHQIEIRRSGYKAWLTALELSPRETQTLRVVLEPLGGTPPATDAMLALATTPSDLEVMLDGQLLAMHTPIRMPLKIGTHAIAVRQNGVVVWTQRLNAAAASNYEFRPSFIAEQERERAARDDAPVPSIGGEPTATPEPPPTAEPHALAPAPATAAPTTAAPIAPPPAAQAPAAAAPIAPTLAARAPAPAAPTARPPAVSAPKPVPTEIVTVPPNAVVKLSGAVPNVVRAMRGLPAIAAAKLCIDANGAVTNVDVLSKLDRRVTADLTESLQTWRYQPYRRGDVAVPACFAITIRLDR